MSDQCRNCSIRGLSVDRCSDTKETACSIPESWYAIELKANHEQAMREKDEVVSQLQNALHVRDEQIAALQATIKTLEHLINNDADAKEVVRLRADKKELEILCEVEHDQGESFFVQIESLVADNQRQAEEIQSLHAQLVAGEPPYYTKWKEQAKVIERLNKALDNIYVAFQEAQAALNPTKSEEKFRNLENEEAETL